MRFPTLLSGLAARVALVAVALGACTPAETGDGGDGGGGADATRTPDAAVGADASRAPDAGGGADASRAPDAGADADASRTPDAGAEPTADAAVPPPGPWRVVGYYAGWATYDRNFQVDALPADRLTHLNYAFANVVEGTCALGDPWADVQKPFEGDTQADSEAGRAGNFGRLRRLKASHPGLRTLISVGGWSWSGGFSDAAASPEARRRFAEGCADFVVEHGFDGLDVDWEYPQGGGMFGGRPEDRANHALLLAETRAALQARAPAASRAEPYLLTAAVPAGAGLMAHFDLSAAAAELDWLNLMTYDMAGAWDAATGFNAPLDVPAEAPPGSSAAELSVTATAQAYLAAGVPAGKLVLGVPFYGRSFAGVPEGGTQGLYQPSTGPGPGTWEAGSVDFRDLGRFLGQDDFQAHRHPQAAAPWLYSARQGVFITYDDAESLAAKRDRARALGLGGVMIWELSADDPAGTLIGALQ